MKTPETKRTRGWAAGPDHHPARALGYATRSGPPWAETLYRETRELAPTVFCATVRELRYAALSDLALLGQLGWDVHVTETGYERLTVRLKPPRRCR